ncbi:MAG: D-alanyl-lipoteichoic acid biosynthesis protein DltD, partial [Catonella sp.]
MIKMKALVYAICLALVSMIGLNASLSGAYQVPDNSIRYGRQVEKNQSKDILTQNMDAQTLTVFGSSELVQTFKENFDPSVVFNY